LFWFELIHANIVMAALVAATHDLLAARKIWVAGAGPAMTEFE
jgi:hypothetical protein